MALTGANGVGYLHNVTLVLLATVESLLHDFFFPFSNVSSSESSILHSVSPCLLIHQSLFEFQVSYRAPKDVAVGNRILIPFCTSPHSCFCNWALQFEMHGRKPKQQQRSHTTRAKTVISDEYQINILNNVIISALL